MRRILGVYSAPAQHWVGDGFPVRAMISPGSHGQQLSPFIMLDYAGPAEFAPAERPRGVGEHPHRGFETVTIVYQGEVEHRDSAGNGGVIGPGDVQWMTAASGILHQEFHSREFTRKGGTLEMVQLWVNLPAADKQAKPGYQALAKSAIPEVDLADGAGKLRVIAGDYRGHKGPARTFTPVEVWDVRMGRDKHVALQLPEGHTVSIAVLHGTVLVNDAQVARGGQLVVLDRTGGDVSLEANNEAKLLVLAGAPIDEPVVAHGPFVMNTPAEIRQAILDYQGGRFGSMH
jgi:redox-sensitive bicupin YhaK (pirin superfamily)